MALHALQIVHTHRVQLLFNYTGECTSSVEGLNGINSPTAARFTNGIHSAHGKLLIADRN